MRAVTSMKKSLPVLVPFSEHFAGKLLCNIQRRLTRLCRRHPSSRQTKEIKSKLSAYLFNWKIKIFLSVLNPSCYSLPLQVNCNKRDLKCFFLSQRILAQQCTKHSFINSLSEKEILCFGGFFVFVFLRFCEKPQSGSLLLHPCWTCKTSHKSS